LFISTCIEKQCKRPLNAWCSSANDNKRCDPDSIQQMDLYIGVGDGGRGNLPPRLK